MVHLDNLENKDQLMQNPNFPNLKSSVILAGIISVAGLITLPEVALAKTKSQLAQLAIPVTVQINSVAGTGSGVIINQEGPPAERVYTVLTANHLVKDAPSSYQVNTYTGNNYEVTEIKKIDKDLALVKFTSTEFYPVASRNQEPIVLSEKPIDLSKEPLKLNEARTEARTEQTTKKAFFFSKDNPVALKDMSGKPIFNLEGKLVGLKSVQSDQDGHYAFNSAILNTLTGMSPSQTASADPQEGKTPLLTASADPQDGKTPSLTASADSKDKIKYESGSLPPTGPSLESYQYVNRYAGAAYFYCDQTGKFPITVVSNVLTQKKLPLIRWENNSQVESSMTPKERCQKVSGRFQRAYYENRLDFLQIADIDKKPVVCGISSQGGVCEANNTLISFQPGTKVEDWLNSFLPSNTNVVEKKIEMTKVLQEIRDDNNSN